MNRETVKYFEFTSQKSVWMAFRIISVLEWSYTITKLIAI